MTGVLVGLDVGTTAAKAVVTDVSGATISRSRSPITWAQTAFGTEVAPESVVAAARTAMADALQGCADEQVLAVGVTSMGESGVLIDATGHPVAPMIAWHDTRDSQEVAELAAGLGEQKFGAATGLPFRGQWSLTKHRWQVRHVPGTRRAVRRLGVAEWVVRALGGDEVCELSLASRTGWLHLSERQWWTEAITWSELSPTLLPDLVQAGTPTGRVTRSAGVSGLEGAVLTVAGHDHQAAAVGADATQPGDVLDSCGTAEALVRTVEPGLDGDAVLALAAAGITTGWHVLADRWCLLGGTQGGLALQRVLRMLGLGQTDITRLDNESSLDENVRVSGVDTAELQINGICDQVGPADVWHAALRAVTDRSAVIHASMTDIVGSHRDFIVTGGWATSTGLLAAKRAAFGTVRVAQRPEAGAHGAARLAGVAAHVVDTHELALLDAPVEST